MRHGIEGVAFDLDGTLYPNYRLNLKLIPFILKELRLMVAFGRTRSIIRKEQKNPAFPQATLQDKGGFYKYQAEISAKLLNIPPDAAAGKQPEEPSPESLEKKIDRLIYKGWEPLFKTVKLYKNAVETLAALREAGYKLGLMSDFPPETKMEYLGLTFCDTNGKTNIWDAVLCSEHCGALKPHPLPFRELAAAMSLPPEKILYVGNSRSYDVAGAAGAGMKTAWIKSALFPGSGFKKPRPDFTFSNYRQLCDFMLR